MAAALFLGGSDSCSAPSTCSDPTMPESCALISSVGTDSFDPTFVCNRIFSPSLTYSLVLENNGNLAIYSSNGRQWWSTNTSVQNPDYQQRLELRLLADGSWSYLLGHGDGRQPEIVSSSRYGMPYPDNAGRDQGPYWWLRMGDDGIAFISNIVGRKAWVSRVPDAPPPAPPLSGEIGFPFQGKAHSSTVRKGAKGPKVEPATTPVQKPDTAGLSTPLRRSQASLLPLLYLPPFRAVRCSHGAIFHPVQQRCVWGESQRTS